MMDMKTALQAIAGDIPWPDPDIGFVDLARMALSPTSEEMPTSKEQKEQGKDCLCGGSDE